MESDTSELELLCKSTKNVIREKEQASVIHQFYDNE